MSKLSLEKLLPKGSVLVFSLLILSIMLVTSLTILSSAVLDRKASLSTGSSTRSFQVADSGVEEVLYQIYKGNHATLEDMRSAIGGGATCANGVIKFPVAGGDATVTFYQDETTVYAGPCSGGTATDWRDKVVKIKSEGTAGTTTRAVEVAVAAGSLQCIDVYHDNPGHEYYKDIMGNTNTSTIKTTDLLGKTGSEVCDNVHPGSVCVSVNDSYDPSASHGANSNTCEALVQDTLQVNVVEDDVVRCCW